MSPIRTFFFFFFFHSSLIQYILTTGCSLLLYNEAFPPSPPPSSPNLPSPPDLLLLHFPLEKSMPPSDINQNEIRLSINSNIKVGQGKPVGGEGDQEQSKESEIPQSLC